MSGRATLLTLKLRPDTPQHYENITMENIKLAGGGRLLNVAPWTQFFDLQGQPRPARTVNQVTLRNITGTYGSFGTLRGNPEDALRDITVENVNITLDNDRFAPGPIENIAWKNVVVNKRPYELPAPAPVAAPAAAKAPTPVAK